MAEVFYRKWRPKSMSEVVGQDAIMKTLRQAVAQQRTAHAYLFCGTRGTGKTSTARILAKAINCLSPRDGEPDNECHICVSINEGRSLDLIEIDAASNRGIDDIRELSDKVRFSPTESRYKIYIIDEVHMLTDAAFNALLKTLEEPPEHAKFILATTEAYKLPPTIISRCQRFDFRRIPIERMVAKLADICEQEGIEASNDALQLVARMANGGLRDAENLLEQVVVSYGSPIREDDVRQLLGLGGDEIALELVRHIIAKSVKDGISTVNGASEQGTDLRQLLRGTLEYLRALLLIKTGAGATFGYSDEVMSRLNALVVGVSMEHLVKSLKVFAAVNMRRDAASTLPLELALVDMATEPEPMVAAPAPQQPYAAARQPAPATQAPAPRQQPSIPQAQPYQQPPNRTAPTGAPSPTDAPQQQPYRQPARPAYQPPAASAAPAGRPNGMPAPDGELPSELDAKLAHQWNRIANELRFTGARFKVGAMLRSSREREIVGDTIIIRYPSLSNVDRLNEELETPQTKKALYDAIESAMGSKFEVKVALSDGSNGAGSKRPSQTSHLVQAAQSMGARVIGEREVRQP
ncbi:MAG: DNA polymerase III subunit gamma/tau [Chloroflexota bacterium]|nr:DNA polymerase III subunit gamma/tau [Chloroflexota bacterium]